MTCLFAPGADGVGVACDGKGYIIRPAARAGDGAGRGRPGGQIVSPVVQRRGVQAPGS